MTSHSFGQSLNESLFYPFVLRHFMSSFVFPFFFFFCNNRVVLLGRAFMWYVSNTPSMDAENDAKRKARKDSNAFLNKHPGF